MGLSQNKATNPLLSNPRKWLWLDVGKVKFLQIWDNVEVLIDRQ